MKVCLRICFPAAMAVAAVLVAACAAGKAGGGAMHVWPSGTAVTYDMIRGEVQIIEVPGGGTQESSTSATFVVAVEAVGERQFKIVFTGASTTSSSTDVTPVIGLESTVSLDERGLIAEATGLEGNAYVETRGGIDIFKDDLQSLFLYLPEGSLKPGVEWTREYSYPAHQMGGVMQRSFVDVYRCLEETNYEGTTVFKVAVSANVDFSGSGESGGMELDVAVNGTFAGTIYVDSATGMILMEEISGDLTGGIYAQGMDIPISVKASKEIRKRK